MTVFKKKLFDYIFFDRFKPFKIEFSVINFYETLSKTLWNIDQKKVC